MLFGKLRSAFLACSDETKLSRRKRGQQRYENKVVSDVTVIAPSQVLDRQRLAPGTGGLELSHELSHVQSKNGRETCWNEREPQCEREDRIDSSCIFLNAREKSEHVASLQKRNAPLFTF